MRYNNRRRVLSSLKANAISRKRESMHAAWSFNARNIAAVVMSRFLLAEWIIKKSSPSPSHPPPPVKHEIVNAALRRKRFTERIYFPSCFVFFSLSLFSSRFSIFFVPRAHVRGRVIISRGVCTRWIVFPVRRKLCIPYSPDSRL